MIISAVKSGILMLLHLGGTLMWWAKSDRSIIMDPDKAYQQQSNSSHLDALHMH